MSCKLCWGSHPSAVGKASSLGGCPTGTWLLSSKLINNKTQVPWLCRELLYGANLIQFLFPRFPETFYLEKLHFWFSTRHNINGNKICLHDIMEGSLKALELGFRYPKQHSYVSFNMLPKRELLRQAVIPNKLLSISVRNASLSTPSAHSHHTNSDPVTDQTLVQLMLNVKRGNKISSTASRTDSNERRNYTQKTPKKQNQKIPGKYLRIIKKMVPRCSVLSQIMLFSLLVKISLYALQ